VVVGLPTKGDDILLVLVQRTREWIAFLPDLSTRVLLKEAAEKGVMYLGDAIDNFAIMSIDVHLLTYTAAVSHFDFIDQVIGSRNTLDQPIVIDIQRGCRRR
jgi:hypothetical protein